MQNRTIGRLVLSLQGHLDALKRARVLHEWQGFDVTWARLTKPRAESSTRQRDVELRIRLFSPLNAKPMTSTKWREAMRRVFAPKPKFRCAICARVVPFGRKGVPVRCYYHRNA